jgi:cytochrome c5
MQTLQKSWCAGLLVSMVAAAVLVGCQVTSVDTSEYARGPVPLREPSPARPATGCYEDDLTGGHVFEMYCSSCHNARSLAERPFASYQNAAGHMRVVVNLTGKEYAKMMEFLRRFHDLPPKDTDEAPSPKRMIFGQPIPELRQDKAKEGTDLPAGPRPGAMDEVSPGQPPPGSAPREAR